MYQSEDGKDQAELDEVSSGCSMAGVHLPCPAEEPCEVMVRFSAESSLDISAPAMM